MSDILEEIQALQEQFNNLLGEELEKEGPKGEIKDLSRPPKKDYFDRKIEAAKANFRTADKVARNNWKKFRASDDTDSSGYSDSYADARTADNEREKALDNYEYTKKEMDAARKGKRIEPKSTMEQIRRIRARREGAIKMNDNNSYNEIVSQIMDLKEAFSNLFEVDDLGQPAMDVPPSQNKIKRDRKTKDGKVELVSVEDELFPYEGNKREQYRQKILDTINNMIQGKATLEDLLQIVRQKKAPLKEALEIMEDLFDTILKQPAEKQGSLVYKYHQAKNRENAGKDTYTQAKEEEKRKSKEEKGQEKTEQRKKYRGKSTEDWKQGRLMDQIAKSAANLAKVSDPATAKAIRRNAQKADLKEALEIMEAIINEVSERTKIDAYKKRANQSKLVGDIAKDTAKWHMDRGAYGPAIEVLKKADAAQKKEFKHRLNTMLHDKAFGQDAYNKAEKELRDEWKAEKDIKEALSLMEAIINEVSVGALARAVENNLPKRKKNEEVAIKAYKQAQDEYEKGSKESPEDEPALYKKLQCADKAACKEFDKARDVENLKDLNLPKDSKVSANKLFNAAKKVNLERQKKTEETVKNTKGTKEDAKKFLNSLKRDNRSFDISLADPVKSRNEALEEALAVINEVSKEFLKDKDNKAKVKVLKAIIRHGETITPENPKGDSELLKIRQDSIDRLKKYRGKCKDYLEKKEKRNDK